MRYRKDLLLTDTYLVRGHASTGGRRLTTFLNHTPRRFVEIDEATLAGRHLSESVSATLIMVRLDDILLAHEMDDTGDETLKGLAEGSRDELAVRVYFGGAAPLEVSGMASRRALDRDASNSHRFLVIGRPVLSGLPHRAEYLALEDLPYVTVNRNRVALICG